MIENFKVFLLLKERENYSNYSITQRKNSYLANISIIFNSNKNTFLLEKTRL